MEANLVRILLLIALFFLLSSDYSSVVKHLVPSFEDSDDDVVAEEQQPGQGAISTQQVERQENLQIKSADENESKFSFLSPFSLL